MKMYVDEIYKYFELKEKIFKTSQSIIDKMFMNNTFYGAIVKDVKFVSGGMVSISFDIVSKDEKFNMVKPYPTRRIQKNIKDFENYS